MPLESKQFVKIEIVYCLCTLNLGIIGNDVDPKEIDLFFKVLDNNKNNCIEVIN